MRRHLIARVVVNATALSALAPPALAAEAVPLTLEVLSACPGQALLERELVPLLRGYELASATAGGVTARVQDAGESYDVSVGSFSREVRDPQRDCLERARVAAVFIALNLPAAEEPIEAPAVTKPVEQAPPAVAVSAAPSPANDTSNHSIDLRLFGFAEAAPGAPTSTSGIGTGIALRLGDLSISLTGGVAIPVNPPYNGNAAAPFELWRLPLAALVGWGRRMGGVRLGAEAGLALDVLRFRGLNVPHPGRELRVNPGARFNVELRLQGSRRLSAVLSPGLAFFPGQYQVQVDPGLFLAQTPRWWLGASLGLEYSVWGG